MAFGDVNLSEEPIRGSYNPGAGGWPTIRYFNTKTGYEGAPYTKKTDKAMCEELVSDLKSQSEVCLSEIKMKVRQRIKDEIAEIEKSATR